MNWVPFHHPDISLPVIRRRTSEELISLLSGTAELIFTRGASVIYGSHYPSNRAYQAAVTRLAKRGLIVQSTGDPSLPKLTLTSKGKATIPAYYHPETLWSKKWNQLWYVLMFDVPEVNRNYRNQLRRFLKQNRFGQLQKSVWVTPRDVRPEYDDLDKAAAVDSVAFLFEAKTVLGHGSQSVVRDAWDFPRIKRIQELYIQNVSANLKLLDENTVEKEELLRLVRLDNLAYSQAMSLDPLLPDELLPPQYAGETAVRMHRKLLSQIEKKLA